MSSSESEDEKLRLLSESVDTSIFSDNLYDEKNEMENSNEKCETIELKSQRYLGIEEEKLLKSDLVVSDNMQKFIYNKLATILDNQVEFVDKNDKKRRKKVDDEMFDSLRLLSDSEETVKFYNAPDFIENRRKVPIKRRKVAEDQVEEVEEVHASSAAVDSNFIESEVKLWTSKVRHQPVEYKMIKGVAYIREDQNEFTKIRNKNSWSEKKIKTAKYFNKSLGSLIRK